MNSQTPPTRSTHPLFPSDQAFLWLPGFDGRAQPYCSYNYPCESASGEKTLLSSRNDGTHDWASLHPAFPVSQETFLAWNTTVTPPFPYHPVPIARILSPADLAELAERVNADLQEVIPQDVHPLRNENKCRILVALTKMGLLASRPEPGPVSCVA